MATIGTVAGCDAISASGLRARGRDEVGGAMAHGVRRSATSPRVDLGPIEPRVGAQPRRGRRQRIEPTGLHGLRLTRRGRVVVWGVALVAASVGVFGGARAFATEPVAPTRTDTITVMPGQSLWEFASSVARPGEDVRDAVDRIMELNGLTTANVQVGQRLDLPIDE